MSTSDELEPPRSRRSRTGLIVAIVVVALVLVGGGTATLMLLNRPAPQAQGQAPQPKPVAGGRYTTLARCARLTASPFAFDPHGESLTQNDATTESCQGALGAKRVYVTMTDYLGPKGEGRAVAASLPISSADQNLQRIDKTGFENAPFIGVEGDGDDSLCTAMYRRSNEFVRIDFPDLPDGIDTPGCISTVLPYVRQLYALVG